MLRALRHPAAGLLALLLLAFATPTTADAPRCVPVIETLHDAFIDVMKNATSLGYEGRFEKLDSAISEAYDLDFMARKVVGRHWKKLDEREQRKWQDLFAQFTVANYAGRFEGYTGQRFETIGEQRAAHETVMVQTRLVLTEDEDMEFNYRLHQAEAGWRIIDVYMNGTVSELALRRSDFSSTLKRDGFEHLVASVGKKIAELEESEE